MDFVKIIFSTKFRGKIIHGMNLINTKINRDLSNTNVE
jgi:hypothetical protein